VARRRIGVRAVAAGAVVGAVAAVAVALVGGPHEDGGGRGGERLRWAPCGDEAECTTLEVPLDHDRPGGDFLQLAVARLPATDPGRRLGSVVVNPGGPGAPAVDFLLLDGEATFSDELRERFDIVTFDPRGVAGSGAVGCGSFAGDPVGRPEPVPADDGDAGDYEAALAEVAARCASGAGWLLPHIGTRDSVEDLEALRAALGEEELRYVGYSYGTYLGASYAAAHPDRVAAMVLDGALVPGEQSLEDLAVSQALGGEVALDAWLQRCEDDGCDFAADGDGDGDPRERFDDLLADLVDDDPEVADAFLTALFGLLYDAGSGADARIEDLVLAAEDGDEDELMAAADELLYLETDLGVGYSAVICRDHPAPAPDRTNEEVADALAEQAPMFGRLMAWSEVAPCRDWPVPADPPASPEGVDGIPPLLVIGGRADPATPYASAERLAAALHGSRVLTWDGAGHVASGGRSACIDEAVDEYLLEGTLPPHGTVCRPERAGSAAGDGPRYAPAYVPAGWEVYSALDVESSQPAEAVELLLLTGADGETISVYGAEDDDDVGFAAGTEGRDTDDDGWVDFEDVEGLSGIVREDVGGAVVAVVGTSVADGDLEAVATGVEAAVTDEGVTLSVADPPDGFEEAYRGVLPGYGEEAYGYVSWEHPDLPGSDITVELTLGADYGPEALTGEEAQGALYDRAFAEEDGDEGDPAPPAITARPEDGVLVTVYGHDVSAEELRLVAGSLAEVPAEDWEDLVARADDR
jgi:pimeloyl-ACP methyl ester carboxylesterase